MKRLRIGLWILVAASAALLGYLTLEIGQSSRTVGEAAYGVPFQLVDQRGQPVSEQVLRGKPSAVFFGFTHCPEFCPTTLFELDGWLKQVDPQGGHLNAYFVSVDPERDTTEILNTYVSNVSDRIIGITGAPDKVMEMVKGFRVYAKKVPVDEANPNGDYTMDHTASVFLLDAQGRFKGTIAYGENPETAVQKLQKLMKG
ncbi:SCO family protein [Agrobacterium vitis]|uniref:SCO family protein n=1 Tax=Agrobacterium vitis TaxID=373 RepID=UPI001574C3B4|nr:SCO family protein [Agrobacterium vitis]NSZ17229.1 SCO family protein [Agrobacterium vitis]QZO02949.1 SCO family protein [Agrobacterium vitis]UJL88072.1 SCO family protein [Agrobacterium vitis]